MDTVVADPWSNGFDVALKLLAWQSSTPYASPGKKGLQFVPLGIEILQARRRYEWVLRLQDFWRVVRFVKKTPVMAERSGGSGRYHLLPTNSY